MSSSSFSRRGSQESLGCELGWLKASWQSLICRASLIFLFVQPVSESINVFHSTLYHASLTTCVQLPLTDCPLLCSTSCVRLSLFQVVLVFRQCMILHTHMVSGRWHFSFATCSVWVWLGLVFFREFLNYKRLFGSCNLCRCVLFFLTRLGSREYSLSFLLVPVL